MAEAETHSPVIRFERVGVRLPDELLFGDLNLEAAPGEGLLVTAWNLPALLRLLDMAAGFLPADRGSILWWGRPAPPAWKVWERHAFLRRFGLVTRKSQLISQLTLLENLALSYEYARERNPRTKARKTLERFDLVLHEQTPAHALPESKRRLALYALAFAKAPGLFIMERPRSFLDADFDFVWDLLVRTAKIRGRAFLVFERSTAGYELGDFTAVADFAPSNDFEVQ